MGGSQVEKERYQIAWCQLTFNENAPEVVFCPNMGLMQEIVGLNDLQCILRSTEAAKDYVPINYNFVIIISLI